ncbi:DUF927 domain-containing protein [Rickettsiella endosymbiont of Dermanyssus gallinae]|uniref:DUF927 domain-containing protein n=1 Tax=Rickettsiella endosymbiont of Dermanyssus gallinae TaxID=2856608 RepID=UPI001C533B77|nr:DUF927 domain-containing protein [Rickettsiella endosymbiont of Dermanyssus gallinae]
MNNLLTQEIIQGLINKFAKNELKDALKDYKHTGTHVYYNKDETVALLKIRLKDITTGKKWIRPFHYDSEHGKYIIGEPKLDHGKPLYRLPELIKRTDETIWFCEGESCVEAMESYGLLATTSGSANSDNTTDFSPLANRKVNFFCDYDEAGIKYRENVTAKLQALGCTVRWVDVEQLHLPKGGDFIDWMEAKGNITKEDILQLPLIDAPNLEDAPIPFCPFEVRDDGVFYCKEEEKLPIWLCPKLEITALSRDPNNENWGRVLKFNDADGHSHRWVMPDTFLGNGEQATSELFRQGLTLHPGLKQKRHLLEYLATSPVETKVRCIDHTGWYKQSFLLPDKVYYPSSENEEALIYHSDYTLHNYSKLGTLDEWTYNVSKYCAGNSRLMFAVALAFAGPLVGLLGLESGGFHLVGESSIGKSTALAVAASVYGGKNYVRTLRTTDNGLEGLAAQHNHALLILDELSQLNSRIAGDVFYMLANGQGKARAFRTGQAKNIATWCLLFLTSGELSLRAHLESAGQTIKAGQEIRSINISADAGKGYGIFEDLHGHKDGASLSNYLKEQCQRSYGSAIDAFLTYLVKADKEKILKERNEIAQEFLTRIKGDNAHGQVKRVVERFALVAAAGELAIEWDIVDSEKEDSIEATFTCFESWMNDHREGGMSSSEEEKILEHVRHYFETQSSRFDSFLVKSFFKGNRAGFVDESHHKPMSGDYYVFVKTFKQELCKGFEPKIVEQLLLKKGLLKPNAAGKIGEPIWVPSCEKSMRLYHFPSLILGEKTRAH